MARVPSEMTLSATANSGAVAISSLLYSPSQKLDPVIAETAPARLCRKVR